MVTYIKFYFQVADKDRISTEQVVTTKAGGWFSEFLLAEKLENSKKVGKLGEKVGKIQ